MGDGDRESDGGRLTTFQDPRARVEDSRPDLSRQLDRLARRQREIDREQQEEALERFRRPDPAPEPAPPPPPPRPHGRHTGHGPRLDLERTGPPPAPTEPQASDDPAETRDPAVTWPDEHTPEPYTPAPQYTPPRAPAWTPPPEEEPPPPPWSTEAPPEERVSVPAPYRAFSRPPSGRPDPSDRAPTVTELQRELRENEEQLRALRRYQRESRIPRAQQPPHAMARPVPPRPRIPTPLPEPELEEDLPELPDDWEELEEADAEAAAAEELEGIERGRTGQLTRQGYSSRTASLAREERARLRRLRHRVRRLLEERVWAENPPRPPTQEEWMREMNELVWTEDGVGPRWQMERRAFRRRLEREGEALRGSAGFALRYLLVRASGGDHESGMQFAEDPVWDVSYSAARQLGFDPEDSEDIANWIGAAAAVGTLALELLAGRRRGGSRSSTPRRSTRRTRRARRRQRARRRRRARRRAQRRRAAARRRRRPRVVRGTGNRLTRRRARPARRRRRRRSDDPPSIRDRIRERLSVLSDMHVRAAESVTQLRRSAANGVSRTLDWFVQRILPEMELSRRGWRALDDLGARQWQRLAATARRYRRAFYGDPSGRQGALQAFKGYVVETLLARRARRLARRRAREIQSRLPAEQGWQIREPGQLRSTIHTQEPIPTALHIRRPDGTTVQLGELTDGTVLLERTGPAPQGTPRFYAVSIAEIRSSSQGARRILVTTPSQRAQFERDRGRLTERDVVTTTRGRPGMPDDIFREGGSHSSRIAPGDIEIHPDALWIVGTPRGEAPSASALSAAREHFGAANIRHIESPMTRSETEHFARSLLRATIEPSRARDRQRRIEAGAIDPERARERIEQLRQGSRGD